jgi:alkylation response protein AidB-like acyl-CoA dehydrogenase
MAKTFPELEAIEAVADGFRAERAVRQQRTTLHREDFDRLAEAGLLRAGLPESRGGLWSDARGSTRRIGALYRALAGGDSSVALVAAMHPAVLAFWLATEDVPPPDAEAWHEQREAVFDTVEAGAWWGTITSEPGSGGDVARTRAAAHRRDGQWHLEGQKHFGSGTGITSYMLTTARPPGEDPDWFYLRVEGEPQDGSTGITVMAPWDGFGMRATQSHAMRFDGYAAERVAWPGHLLDIAGAAAPFFGAIFIAVALGVVEEAMTAARARLADRVDELRPYEQVEWAQAELEAWTMAQVYDGAVRAIEEGAEVRGASLRAKVAAAQLAESCLLRLCRILGGGTYARSSPFGCWFEDVRALGFLRPPWGLAVDALIADLVEAASGEGSAPRP